MKSSYEKILNKINSGSLSRKELETLMKNAKSKGGADEVLSACELMLSKLPKSGSSGGKRSSTDIFEKRSGFNIMASAIDDNGNLHAPELIAIAEFHAKNNLISDISVLKTQIKLYYKGRHFTSGARVTKGLFWISCLDETKITDSTIEKWEGLGTVVGGTYFSTRYVAVEVDELDKLNTAFECVSFT